MTRRFRRDGERRFQRVQLFSFDSRPRTSTLGTQRHRAAADRRERRAARAPRRDVAAVGFVFG